MVSPVGVSITAGFLDRTGSQDGHLRLIDDGRTHDVAESTHIGDGKSSVLDFFRLKFILSGSVCKVVYSIR